MPVKVTYQFQFAGTGKKSYGPSESHILPGSPADLTTLFPQAARLGTARCGFLSANVNLTVARLSLIGSPRVFENLYPGTAPPGVPPMAGVGQLAGTNSDQANACLQVELRESSAKKGRMFMTGVPDDIIVVGLDAAGKPAPGPNYAAVPGFLPAYRAWKAQLKADSWQFRARKAVATTAIGSVVQSAIAPFNVIIQWAAAATTLTQGDKIQIRGLLNFVRGTPTLNGIWRVDLVTVGAGVVSVTLANTSGFAATDVLRPGTWELVQYDYFNVNDTYISGQTTRKRGVGSNRARGRSKRRRTSFA